MAFDTILIQGEALSLGSQTDGPISLVRTRDENQEQPGVDSDGVTPNGLTGNGNTGLPNFDIHGLRPDYTGDGYFDINGTAGEKAVSVITGLPTEATTVDVYIRVANGSSGTAIGNLRPITVTIDGVGETIANSQTGQFFLWGVQKITLDLPESLSGRQLTITTAASNGPNIDAIAIVEGGLRSVFCRRKSPAPTPCRWTKTRCSWAP